MKKSSLKPIVSFFAVLVFIVLAVGSDDQGEIEKEVTKQEAVESLSARELYEAYESNGVAADQKYKGKILRVSGEVNTIDRDILDEIYVTLNTGDHFGSIQCYFSEAHADKAAQLSKGDMITVKGRCDGKLSNVSLKGCIID